jgi:hypothetical protein
MSIGRTHGTHSMYNAGCHCDLCKRAEMDYRRWRRQNPRADTKVSHGPRAFHPATSHPGRVTGIDTHGWTPDEIACLCWCQTHTVGVTPTEIRAGRTRTCGLPDCNERILA